MGSQYDNIDYLRKEKVQTFHRVSPPSLEAREGSSVMWFGFQQDRVATNKRVIIKSHDILD